MRTPAALRRTLSLARKEVRHVLRDPFTLGLAIGLPLALLAFFGYAMDFDVREVHVAYFDRDQSRASRQLVDIFNASQYFRMTPGTGLPSRALDRERARAVLIIEQGFQKDFGAGKSPKVQFLLDGADNSTSGVISSYLAGIQPALWRRLSGRPNGEPVKLETRFLFNPELRSRWFVVPGLLVVIMGLLATMLTALTVAREWETGSMELLLSSPVRPLEIIVGKLLPYLGLCLLSMALVYLCARLLFGVPFQGSYLALLAGTLLFLAPCLGQGLIISVVTRQQMAAFQLSMLSTMIPSMLLSGFVFPIESMPAFFHYFTAILPARWFMQVCRAVFLRPPEMAVLWAPLAALALLTLALVSAALLLFKTDLEP